MTDLIDGVYLLKDVEEYLDEHPRIPDLIFTSPPFDVTPEHRKWLMPVFSELARIVPEHGSMVVTLGNCWDPPEQTTDTLDLLKEIHWASGLDLKQMFVIRHDRARMSPFAAERMANEHRALDHVSYAWWLGKPEAQWRDTFSSNVINEVCEHEERVWLKRQGYHAALSASVPLPFIRNLTKPGDLVMDPFAGLNATGAAARSVDRRWLSLDTDPAMMQAALSRP